ncbi:HOG (high osmolarity glycerol) pathway protein [Neocucurbitaria cava]|uniref:HOG (High osmolarity glycerol) pathway protein n=1 Tax=Neocucurbitaria cava TaxID=798079 RepID=A0A9W8Y307_9PLEO|nr:HOG (high osmolarity glycerol) pathway protein [Neocucurbitaria cava]
MTDTATAPETPAETPRLDDITEGVVVRGRQNRSDMAADVLSPRSEPGSAGTMGVNRTSLPPLVTSPPSRAKVERASSYINKRLSTFSNTSNTPQQRPSRPQSIAYPIFHSSLPYSLVRDFAYDPFHPLFYGPLPEQPSDISTPASEVGRRLSDPPPVPWRSDRGWSAGSNDENGEQLPQTSYDGGPPYSEDEDISSPVVTSHHGARHKKHKSNIVNFDQTRGRRGYPEEHRRGSIVPVNNEDTQAFNGTETIDSADGSRSEYITYPPNSSRLGVPEGASRRDSHFAATLPPRTYADAEGPPYDSDDDMSEPEDYIHDDNRFSRDYQFTIASPDEEMHGKAVALFDFARENDNELPLVEGQVILVSYRHGQGWLVAQDPKTGESGLVPEEYVRLLRDIEGGWNGLMNGTIKSQEANNDGPEGLLSPVSADPEAKTPTQADHPLNYTPVISTFSTSHKDLEPYPKDRLGTPTNPEGGSFGKGKESGAMEGVESTPEPQTQQQQQQQSS